jgi:hypothetical protein
LIGKNQMPKPRDQKRWEAFYRELTKLASIELALAQIRISKVANIPQAVKYVSHLYTLAYAFLGSYPTNEIASFGSGWHVYLMRKSCVRGETFYNYIAYVPESTIDAKFQAHEDFVGLTLRYVEHVQGDHHALLELENAVRKKLGLLKTERCTIRATDKLVRIY